MKIISKKGFAVGDMLPLGITIVVLGVGLGLGLQVLGDVQGDQTTSSAEYNATGDAIEGVAKIHIILTNYRTSNSSCNHHRNSSKILNDEKQLKLTSGQLIYFSFFFNNSKQF